MNVIFGPPSGGLSLHPVAAGGAMEHAPRGYAGAGSHRHSAHPIAQCALLLPERECTTAAAPTLRPYGWIRDHPGDEPGSRNTSSRPVIRSTVLIAGVGFVRIIVR